MSSSISSPLIVAIATKWLVIGRFKPGRYPIWGVYYFRWWLVQRALALTHLKWLQGSPLMRVYLQVLGMKIGQDANISEVEIGALDLISIGAGTTIGQQVKLSNVTFEGAEMIIGPIEIGPDCSIGSACVIEDHWCWKRARSCATSPPFRRTRGSPPGKSGTVRPAAVSVRSTRTPRPFAQVGQGKRAVQTFLYALMLLAIPPVGLLPLFPAFWVFDRIDEWLGLAATSRMLYMAAIPIMAWPTSFVMVLVTVAFIVVVRWTVLPAGARGRLFGLFLVLSAQMGGGAGHRNHARNPVLALCDGLHARLVPPDGRQDRQGFGNLHQSRRPLRSGRDRRQMLYRRRGDLGDEEVRRGWMRLERLRRVRACSSAMTACCRRGRTFPTAR